MGKLEKIPFERESCEITEKVKDYWSKRSESFAEHKHLEIHSEKNQMWQKELEGVLPDTKQGRPLSILDVGCGAGFFEAVLSALGHRVTGIDLTEVMIERGRDILNRHQIDAKLLVMDAEHLSFPDESYDVVLSRNLTWTLPHPIDAYKEWRRVLKRGGTLLIYDAEYAKGFHNLELSRNYAHQDVDDEMKEECHQIYHMLSMSTMDRPEWDVGVLKEIGFCDISVDKNVSDRLYAAKDEFYMPDRMFRIRATK